MLVIIEYLDHYCNRIGDLEKFDADIDDLASFNDFARKIYMQLNIHSPIHAVIVYSGHTGNELGSFTQ